MNFTTRFIIAVVSTLGRLYYSWPNNRRKHTIKNEIEKAHKFPSCIGYVDGTLIPLATTPRWSHTDFFSRKGFYAVSCMVVCDHQSRITHFYSGHTGNAHDSRVFRGSELYKNTFRYFQEDEYILADSAYTSSLTVVPVYKKPSGGELSRDKNKFNYYHSSARVKAEHCIGMLKGRFQSLKGLHIPIAMSDDIKLINAWILTCVILHNYLISEKDGFIDVNNVELDPPTKPYEMTASEQALLNRLQIDENRLLSEARCGPEKLAILKRIVLNE